MLGPYLIHEHQPDSTTSALRSTGYSVQFAMAEEAVTIPIYIRPSRWGSERPDFCDYFYPSSALNQCKYFDLEFMYRPDFDSMTTDEGVFYSIPIFLAALYSTQTIHFPLGKFLDDFVESLPIHTSFHAGAVPPAAESITVNKFSLLGFCISRFTSYGRSITADICYVPKPARWIEGSSCALYAGSMNYRPKADGTLGEGKWHQPVEHTLWDTLHTQLRQEFSGRPIDALSTRGVDMALAAYEWTPLARMTAKESKAARLRFVNENRNLLSDLKTLAKTMRAAGLYSENTSESQIVKFLLTIPPED